MLGGSFVLRIACLLWFGSPCGFAQVKTTFYPPNVLRAQGGGNVAKNAFNSRFYRKRNNSWNRMNSLALSYTRNANQWNHVRRHHFYDVFDGSDYDWDGFPGQQTPTWPPDYDTWPQAATQSPPQIPQVQPQIPQQVASQSPYQVPYQVPPATPTQTWSPVAPPPPPAPAPAPAPATAQAQAWPARMMSQKTTNLHTTWTSNLVPREASRICSPGPPLTVNPLFRNCLIIGDSISLGYLGTVKSELQGLCQVQHAPFAKGSGAVDSRYGLQCLSMSLRTTALEPTAYDAIVFNFGMHDINYSNRFPEEFVPLAEYGENLSKIKEILLETGAKLAFALTTPVPSSQRRSERVVSYNQQARRVMSEGKRVETLDLHAAVIGECGEPPYEMCSIMKRPKDVHFNPKGNKLLGVKIASTFRKLLSQVKSRAQLSPPNAPELAVREGLASSFMFDDDSTICPDVVTRCPVHTTCCENLLSLTGYGCCMEPDAVKCPDSWHCCPQGSHCSPDCNFMSCKCLFPSSHPALGKLGGGYRSSNHSKYRKAPLKGSSSQSTSHSTDHKHGGSTHGKPKQEGPSKNKSNRSKTKSKNNSNKKSKKKVNAKEGHRGKKTEKLASKAKHPSPTHTSKQPSHSKKAKPIHSVSMTHKKTNYHPKRKQHFVTEFNDDLSEIRKHKPNIKFAHTWGKRKHQHLSYKLTRPNDKQVKSDASLSEELGHLIVNHRTKTFRTTFKVPFHKRPVSHVEGILSVLKSVRKKAKKLKKINPHLRRIFKQRTKLTNLKTHVTKNNFKGKKLLAGENINGRKVVSKNKTAKQQPHPSRTPKKKKRKKGRKWKEVVKLRHKLYEGIQRKHTASLSTNHLPKSNTNTQRNSTGMSSHQTPLWINTMERHRKKSRKHKHLNTGFKGTLESPEEDSSIDKIISRPTGKKSDSDHNLHPTSSDTRLNTKVNRHLPWHSPHEARSSSTTKKHQHEKLGKHKNETTLFKGTLESSRDKSSAGRMQSETTEKESNPTTNLPGLDNINNATTSTSLKKASSNISDLGVSPTAIKQPRKTSEKDSNRNHTANHTNGLENDIGSVTANLSSVGDLLNSTDVVNRTVQRHEKDNFRNHRVEYGRNKENSSDVSNPRNESSAVLQSTPSVVELASMNTARTGVGSDGSVIAEGSSSGSASGFIASSPYRGGESNDDSDDWVKRVTGGLEYESSTNSMKHEASSDSLGDQSGSGFASDFLAPSRHEGHQHSDNADKIKGRQESESPTRLKQNDKTRLSSNPMPVRYTNNLPPTSATIRTSSNEDWMSGSTTTPHVVDGSAVNVKGSTMEFASDFRVPSPLTEGEGDDDDDYDTEDDDDDLENEIYKEEFESSSNRNGRESLLLPFRGTKGFPLKLNNASNTQNISGHNRSVLHSSSGSSARAYSSLNRDWHTVGEPYGGDGKELYDEPSGEMGSGLFISQPETQSRKAESSQVVQSGSYFSLNDHVLSTKNTYKSAQRTSEDKNEDEELVHNGKGSGKKLYLEASGDSKISKNVNQTVSEVRFPWNKRNVTIFNNVPEGLTGTEQAVKSDVKEHSKRVSWMDNEIQQLLYWLSTSKESNNSGQVQGNSSKRYDTKTTWNLQSKKREHFDKGGETPQINSTSKITYSKMEDLPLLNSTADFSNNKHEKLSTESPQKSNKGGLSVVLPDAQADSSWSGLLRSQEKISLRPSPFNFKGESKAFQRRMGTNLQVSSFVNKSQVTESSSERLTAASVLSGSGSESGDLFNLLQQDQPLVAGDRSTGQENGWTIDMKPKNSFLNQESGNDISVPRKTIQTLQNHGATEISANPVTLGSGMSDRFPWNSITRTHKESKVLSAQSSKVSFEAGNAGETPNMNTSKYSPVESRKSIKETKVKSRKADILGEGDRISDDDAAGLTGLSGSTFSSADETQFDLDQQLMRTEKKINEDWKAFERGTNLMELNYELNE